MKIILPVSLLAVVLSGATLPAQTAVTCPVGAVKIMVKGNATTVVSVPLTATPNYVGLVASNAAGAGNTYNLNVSGATGWTANQFAKLYYVRMTSGAKAGMYYTITANTTGQVTVDTAGDNLSGIAGNDTFKILKYWTLGTLFPPAKAGTAANPLTASLGLEATQRRSQIFLPDNTSVGHRLPAIGSFFLFGPNWVSSATGNAISDDTILFPDTYFTVRQPASLADASWISVGSVVLEKITLPLATNATELQDNSVSITRPVDLKISELGLEPSFVDSMSLVTDKQHLRDRLIVFSFTPLGTPGTAKAYFHYANNWYENAPGTPIANNQIIPAGSGLIVRKYWTSIPSTTFWANVATY